MDRKNKNPHKGKKGSQAKEVHSERKQTTAPLADSNTLSGDTAQLVTVDSLSRSTGIPRVTLYVMARRRMIPCYKTGANRHGLRFVVAEVLQALRQPMTVTAVSSGGDEVRG